MKVSDLCVLCVNKKAGFGDPANIYHFAAGWFDATQAS
jgi:hypothetical protein